MTPEQQAQDIVQRQEIKDALYTEASANGEQTSFDGGHRRSRSPRTRTLNRYWSYSGTTSGSAPRPANTSVRGRSSFPPRSWSRLLQENIPFEVRKVARAGDISPGELSRIRYKNGLMTGLM